MKSRMKSGGLGSAVSCESLEGRRFLSASATLEDGVIIVRGTPRADTLEVWRNVGRGGKVRVEVRRSMELLGTFPAAGVRGVKLIGGRGDDAIRVGHELVASLVEPDTPIAVGPIGVTTFADGARVLGGAFLIPVTIIGGAGDDTIDGGSADDRLEGGSGDDSVRGGAGDDELFGQNGDDTLAGGTGNDYVEGGDGRDDVNGDGREPAVTGGAGLPILLLSQSKHDTVIGGQGGDRFHEADEPSERRDVTDIDLVYGF